MLDKRELALDDVQVGRVRRHLRHLARRRARASSAARVVNAATGAWARFTGWDAMCFVRMRGDMFFGTQTGKIMQADRTGYDNGLPYVATWSAAGKCSSRRRRP